MRSVLMLGALPVLAGACGDDRLLHARAETPSPSGALCSGIHSLRVMPPDSEIDVGDGRGARVGFRALAVLVDGSTSVVPAAWSLDDAEVGTVDADGVFTPTNAFGGALTVRARFAGVESNASVHAKLVRHLSDAPEAIAGLFDADRPRLHDASSPRLIEPASRRQFLPEEPAPRFAWSNGGRRWTRLRLSSGTVEVDVLTSETVFEPAPELWDAIRRSVAGRALRIDVESADEAEATVHAAEETHSIRVCAFEDRCNDLDDDCDGYLDPECAPEFEPESTPGGPCP